MLNYKLLRILKQENVRKLEKTSQLLIKLMQPAHSQYPEIKKFSFFNFHSS